MAFTDGSRDKEGKVASGWCNYRGGKECELVGLVATVWDGVITGMQLVLESLAVAPLLVLSDSRAAIASVKYVAACGHATSADLRALKDMAGEWASVRAKLRFG